MFDKSASSITDYLLSSESFDPEYRLSLLQTSLKKKADIVIESIEGYQMTMEQKERMIMARSHLEYVQQSIVKLDEKLDKMVTPYEILEKQKEKTIKPAIKLLISNGLIKATDISAA